MLILTRKPGESLFIGDKIKVVVVEIKGNQIRLGIEAPSDVRILREEIYAQILEENQSAAQPVSGASLEGLAAVIPAGGATTAASGLPRGGPRVGGAAALSGSFRKANESTLTPSAGTSGSQGVTGVKKK